MDANSLRYQALFLGLLYGSRFYPELIYLAIFVFAFFILRPFRDDDDPFDDNIMAWFLLYIWIFIVVGFFVIILG